MAKPSQLKANKRYEQEKRKQKLVSFNVETESELLNFANKVQFSNWVKDQIKEEIKK